MGAAGLRRQRDILSDYRIPGFDYDCPRKLTEAECETNCCRMCHAADAYPDDPGQLCNSCATEQAMDRAELDREDCRVGLCAHGCGRD